jgi:hypothetical protein
MTISPSQIKAARDLLGWTKVMLALQSGVGSFVIDKFERGERTLQPGSLDALRSALEAGGAEFTKTGARLKKKP